MLTVTDFNGMKDEIGATQQKKYDSGTNERRLCKLMYHISIGAASSQHTITSCGFPLL